MRIYFWVDRRFRLPRAGRGSTKIAMSVMMLPAALIYQKGRFGMHVPSISGVQNLGIGLQLKVVTRSWDRDQQLINAKAVRTTMRIFRTAKTR